MSAPTGLFPSLDDFELAAAPEEAAPPVYTPPPSAQIVSLPTRVTFAADQVQPPAGVYVTVDDVLSVRLANTDPNVQIVHLRVRFLTPDGVLKWFDIPTPITATDGSRLITTTQLAEGYILGLTLVPEPVNPARGRCFGQVALGRGATQDPRALELLMQNYIELWHYPSWPWDQIISSVEGPGYRHTVPIADPAAGQEIVITCPANLRWNVRALRFALVTSAAVASRTPRVNLKNSNQFSWVMGALSGQNAGITRFYNAAPAVPLSQAADTSFLVPMPPEVILLPGETISTNTPGLDAADQFTACTILVEEWIDA